MSNPQGWPKFQVIDEDGNPVVGAKIYTYVVNTTNDAVTYSEHTLTTPNANPVITDDRGECVIYADGQVKLYITDADDVEITTQDYVGDTFADDITTLQTDLALEHTNGAHTAATNAAEGTSRFATSVEAAAGTSDAVGMTPLTVASVMAAYLSPPYWNLKAYNNSVAPTTKIDLTADFVVVSTVAGVNQRINSFSKTVDCTTTGADALDAGSLATGWYFFYAIAKADGTNAGLASTSATSPTLPSGYTYKKLLSAVYYNTTTFRLVNQIGNRVWMRTENKIFDSAGAAWGSNDCSAHIPTNAVLVKWLIRDDNTGYGINSGVAWDASATGVLYTVSVHNSFGGVGNIRCSQLVDFVLNPAAPQTVYDYSYDAQIRGSYYLRMYQLDI
jgi:hypothetical protein